MVIALGHLASLDLSSHLKYEQVDQITIEVSPPQPLVFLFYGYNYFSGCHALGCVSGSPEVPLMNVHHHCCSSVREDSSVPHLF